MNRVIASLILVAFMGGPAAAEVNVLFERVDEVAQGWSPDGFQLMRVRGIPQGQTEPLEIVAFIGYEDSNRDLAAICERMALLATSGPGRYFFQIATQGFDTHEFLFSCRLIRR